MYLHVLIFIMQVWIQCSFFKQWYMPIHSNTYQYVLIQNIGLKSSFNTFMLVMIVLICIVFSNKSQIHVNMSKYRYYTDPILSWRKANLWSATPAYWYEFACFLREFCMDLHVFACSGGGLPTTGSCQCCIACIACIGRYAYVFVLYLYVYCLYIQAVYKRIQTYRPILNQYKHRKYVCIMYVECMYYTCMCVYLCVLISMMWIISSNQISWRMCTCQWIWTVSAVITATACLFSTHHSANSGRSDGQTMAHVLM